MFFSDDYSEKSQEELQEILADCLKNGNIPSMVVTMGGKGSVYADCEGLRGFCPPKNVSDKRYHWMQVIPSVQVLPAD